MEKNEKRSVNGAKRAIMLSGIGMGLLLGMIMGLSVSEVVKVIMGALTALLGAFLGFDKRSYAGVSQEDYQKENQAMVYTSLRAGYFGLAVVAGILTGMFIRTNELFTPAISVAVQKWVDAGYDPATARSFVAFERLGINPKTGEAGPVTELQRQHNTFLFSAKEIQTLCDQTRPILWKDWASAKSSLQEINVLAPLITLIDTRVDEDKKMDFLRGLNFLLGEISDTTSLCKLGGGLEAWKKNPSTERIAAQISRLPQDRQAVLLSAVQQLICQLENTKSH